ncbi:MAG TPA: hypothetical protein VGX23_32095 [Actinocrinis sp.]|nr:hypothetical protein [Actinocrinis sp.]
MNKTDGFLPLPTLLSHALVAFTMEFDNEFEHRMPHRTTESTPATDSDPPNAHRGPWLTSMAMWGNCMRFLDDSGMHVRDLEDLALTKTNLDGMRRWGYIKLSADPDDKRAKPPNEDLIIRPTRAGLAAQEVWRALVGEIDRRWCARFGRGNVDQLRQALTTMVSHSRRPLPCCLPILGYGLWTSNKVLSKQSASSASSEVSISASAKQSSPIDVELPTLLARALLGFAGAYERGSEVSLAIGANLLRVLNPDGLRVRDLPQVTGVAKPGIDMALGLLQKFDIVRAGANPDGSKWKVVQLTPLGIDVKQAHHERLAYVEQQARVRLGEAAVDALRNALEPLVGDPTGQRSPLYGGLAPYPDGWRARLREPNTLPHFPMVLHRGGYPDGS